ncbi:LPD3 domain-containing protein [Helicobacter sp. T3_23-1059]
MAEFITINTQHKDFKTLKSQLDDKLKNLKEMEFINDETQIKATIANTGIKEIISNVRKSVANGFSYKEHFAVAMDLENIFKRAKFQSKSIDIKHNDPNVMIYRFLSPVIIDTKKEANALLTLKEWKENGKRIYALKLEKLVKNKD